MKFIDRVKITLSSGHGGAGCVSFRRETLVPRGGPDGGDGGRGGHVIIRSSKQVTTLFPYKGKKALAAQNGQPGEGQKKYGKDGKDLIVEVPVGTVLLNDQGGLLHDFSSEEELNFLQGGRGGKGNHFFRTSVNQAPEHAQPGEEGESREVFLEIKLLADVGLIGFPNAGKSTLINTLTAARSKVGDYPFTTLTPQLGVFELGDSRSITIADIPGLIHGAHEGAGLGHEFLQHVERTKVLVHLIDLGTDPQRDLWQDYLDINQELEAYNNQKQELGFGELIKRPQVVVFTKTDLADKSDVISWQDRFAKKNIETIAISAAAFSNLDQLKRILVSFVFGDEHAK